MRIGRAPGRNGPKALWKSDSCEGILHRVKTQDLVPVVWFGALGALVGVLFIGRLVLFDANYIPQAGMVPGILPREIVLTHKHAYRSPADPQYGDVVTFWDSSRRYIFVWRLVGKPGDTVVVRYGLPIINGVTAQRRPVSCHLPAGFDDYRCFEESLAGVTYEVAYGTREPETDEEAQFMDAGALVVPENGFFFLGDHRNGSADSRAHGTVPFDRVIGKAVRFLKSPRHPFWTSLTPRASGRTEPSGNRG